MPVVAKQNAEAWPPPYLPSLDGWRALSVLAVMAYHGVSLSSPFAPITSRGANGVGIFFAISGLLITSKLLAELAASGTITISLREFYVRRVFRILPPAFLVLLALLALSTNGVIEVSRAELVSSAAFLRNYVPIPLPRGNNYTAHFWSLAVEEHFYLTWPIALALLGAGRARWFAGGGAIAIAVWRFIDRRYAFSAAWLPGVYPDQRTDRALDGLLWGCLVAIVLCDAGVRARLRKWLSPAVLLGLFAALLVLFSGVVPYYSFFVPMLIPVILAGTVLSPTTWISRALEWEPLRWVGRLSYSMYLWQQLFFVGHFWTPEAWPQRAPWNLALLFGCASASYYLIEKPAIRLGRALLRRPALVKAGAT